jgi:hypothetical protein
MINEIEFITLLFGIKSTGRTGRLSIIHLRKLTKKTSPGSRPASGKKNVKRSKLSTKNKLAT